MANKGIPVPIHMGINLSDPPGQLQEGELKIARNSRYLPESFQLAKINGRVLRGSMGATATGLRWVQFRDGQSFLIGAAGTSYFTTPVDSLDFTARATGLTNVGRMEAVYYNGTDRAYVSDGVNAMRVWSGSGDMRTAGLTAPSIGAVSLVANAATIYTEGTTFNYVHTEYDSVNDVESGPSPVVRMAVSTEGDTFRYDVSAVVNDSTDTIRVYRTQHGGNVFYRVAEFASTILRYYDGDDSEGLGLGWDNQLEWGFVSLDDSFISRQPVMPMVGEPLRGNFVEANGVIPIGNIMVEFQGSLVIAGVADFPQDLYFSMPDFPETFPAVNYVRCENGYGDPITALGKANDRLIIFTPSSIWRMNTLPHPVDPGYGLGVASREEVTSAEGCVAKRSVVNFGVGQPSNRLFYLSPRGPMMTDGYETWPLNQDLDWSSTYVNFSVVDRAVAFNFPKYQEIWLCVASPGSTTNDIAWIYNYHPNHAKHGPVGTWTGPIHIRCEAAAATYEARSEGRVFIADTNGSGNVFEEDNGIIDGQLYDDPDGAIDWEWETADLDFTERSANKRIGRVFMSMEGANQAPKLSYGINRADPLKPISFADVTNRQSEQTLRIGTSTVTPGTERVWRGGAWQTAGEFRFSARELAIAERTVTALEVEAEPMGRQK